MALILWHYLLGIRNDTYS